MTLNDDVTAAIKDKLSQESLTLRQAAKRMGRSHNWLGLKLRGVSPMTTDDLEEIARMLGMDPARIIIDARASHTSD
jgi:transcriptional regulator with XRE-family HTH domain